MKEIILKRLRLLNFKGIRDLEGCSSTTRRSSRDATDWASRRCSTPSAGFLFGKNSDEEGRTSSIKTLDADGNAIPAHPARG